MTDVQEQIETAQMQAVPEQPIPDRQVAKAEKKPIMAGNSVMAIVPNSAEDVFRLAQLIYNSRLAPKGYDTPEAVTIGILKGLELGLKPIQALGTIAVINGRPSIWGDGALGLVRSSGLCDYVTETLEGEGENRVAICEVMRRGEPKPIIRKFSVDDARKAGLWGKGGPWSQYPNRMLQMRARSIAIRDGFADVLQGLMLAEEARDIPREPMRVINALEEDADLPQVDYENQSQTNEAVDQGQGAS